jgi:hypothetical protein
MGTLTDTPVQTPAPGRRRANADPQTVRRALVGLLEEFRRGNIVTPHVEREVIDRYSGALSRRWNDRFPGFPRQPRPFASIPGLAFRSKRDDHLKNIMVRTLISRPDQRKTIVNPVCALARHARDLALRLPDFKVIATDIDPRGDWLCHRVLLRRNPGNFEFARDDIFDPRIDVTPTAVVFFGACGALSDAAMDYAVDHASRFLFCRTCCHDNIGGNTEVARRPTPLNWFYRGKNCLILQYPKKEKHEGFYFSDKYRPGDYPRSDAARSLSDSDEFMAVSRHTPESDVCRTIIDLDRHLRLTEKGYCVWYRGELFVAERTD